MKDSTVPQELNTGQGANRFKVIHFLGILGTQ
jgi:hypothetical protein